MYNNNNQSVIKKITKRALKTNRTRNLLVILAIILTTFMITSIFSLGFSLAKNYQIMMLREAGSTASISITKPSETQLTNLKQLTNQQSIGLQINLGSVINKEPNSKIKLNLEYQDQIRFEKQVVPAISDMEGQYPQKENEIMTSRWVLKQLGIKQPKIGMTIPLTMDLHGQIITQDFIISGFYQDYGFQANTGSILLSKELVDHYQIKQEDHGLAFIESKVGKRDQLTTEVQTVKLAKNQDIEYDYDPKEEVLSTGIVASVIVLIISLFIVLSGYLLIYNVLYISVVKDIHFYGLLKTIGTSPKQIKRIVKRQALCLCFLGIPFGILLSILVSFAIIPTIMAGLGMGGYNSPMPTAISFSPIIFLGGILFAFITTLISCKKPAKIASSISPVEATRYTGTSEKNQSQKEKVHTQKQRI